MIYGNGAAHRAIDVVHQQTAAFLGCTVDELLFTRSTTEAMNSVATGIRWQADDRVLLTDQEHDGGSLGWRHVARRQGVALDRIAIATTDHDPGRIVDRIAAALTPQTRVVSVSHVITTTGRRMPIREIAALARSRGVLCVVDGAQAIGHVAVRRPGPRLRRLRGVRPQVAARAEGHRPALHPARTPRIASSRCSARMAAASSRIRPGSAACR